MLGINLQDVEHGAEALEDVGKLLVARAVDFGGKFKHDADGLGRVEVFVHCRLKARAPRLVPIDGAGLGVSALEGAVKAQQPLVSFFNERGVEADRASVVASQKEKAQHFVAVARAEALVGFLERVAHGPEVAQRLAHLFLNA